MNFAVIQFVRLPCDCVSDAETLQAEGDYLICPWCLSVFYGPDFRKWFLSEPRFVVLERVCLLARSGDRLLEVVGRCEECEVPLAREHGGKNVFHLMTSVLAQISLKWPRSLA